MNPLLMFLLIVLALILATNRRQVDTARTVREMWAPARANGWGRGSLLALGGLLKFALLFLGGLGLITVSVAEKGGQVVWFVFGVIVLHLKDLLNPPVPVGR